MRQMVVRRESVIKRRQHRANWSGIDTAIRMSSDCAIDGTGIQAGTAANAKQTLPQWSFQNATPAVIQNHQMEFFRSVDFSSPTCTGDKRRIYRDLLTGGCSCENLQKRRQV